MSVKVVVSSNSSNCNSSGAICICIGVGGSDIEWRKKRAANNFDVSNSRVCSKIFNSNAVFIGGNRCI